MSGKCSRHRATNLLAVLAALVLFASGAALLGGGIRLLLLGGSAYYTLAGGTLMLVAVLLWRGRAAAAWLYLALLVATWAWALWETGGNGWALIPRVGFLTGLGLVFLLPPVLRRIGAERCWGRWRWWCWWWRGL